MEDELIAIAKAVRARIASAQVDHEPFPHLHVRDCFPAAYYDRLIASWPSADEFNDETANVLSTIYFRPYGKEHERHLIELERGLMSPGSVKNFAFWSGFRRVVEEAIIPSIAEKFATAIRAIMRRRLLRRRPILKASDLEIVGDLLISRRDHHVLGAHIDDLRSLIQLLIYLPPDEGRPHLGTQLFEQIGPGAPKPPSEIEYARCAQYATHLGIEVREVKRIPFTRNTLVANLNHSRSWHGQYLAEPYDRRGYQGFVGVRSELLQLFFEPADAARLSAVTN